MYHAPRTYYIYTLISLWKNPPPPPLLPPSSPPGPPHSISAHPLLLQHLETLPAVRCLPLGVILFFPSFSPCFPPPFAAPWNPASRALPAAWSHFGRHKFSKVLFVLTLYRGTPGLWLFQDFFFLPAVGAFHVNFFVLDVEGETFFLFFSWMFLGKNVPDRQRSRWGLV